MDLSDAMLTQAIANARLAGVAHQTDFRTADAAALPFPDASLDLVVSTLSLHHWDDPVPFSTKSPACCDLAAHSCSLICAATWAPRPGCCSGSSRTSSCRRRLRHIGEPLGSRNAAYTPDEVAALLQTSRLTGWRVARGPFWLSIEGYTV